MNNTIRSFIALDIDQSALDVIEKAQDRLKTLDCNVKWVNPKNIHLTLKFLGDIKISKVESITQVLKNLFDNSPSIQTKLNHIGAFPNIDHPRVIWVNLDDAQHNIVQIANRLKDALGLIGFKKEQRSFSSHITIGRTRSGKNIAALSKELKHYVLPAQVNFVLRSVTMYQSTLTPDGPIYEQRSRIQLK